MEQIHEGLEAKIQSMLESRRRSALLENLLLSLFFLVGGIAFTFFVWFVFDLYLWMFLFRHQYGARQPAILINTLATLIFLAIVLWKKDRILQSEFEGASDFVGQNPLRTFDEIAGSVLVGGPRFLVLGVRAGRLAKKIYSTDLFLLVRPIALAVQRRRKVREGDLAGVRMDWFLNNSEWIHGVVPLLRKPTGFTVTTEFIREALGEDVPEEEFAYSRAQPGFESEAGAADDSETIDDEVRWALMVLGVERDATRAQINAAYRKFAKLVHPDLYTNEPEKRAQSEEQMKDLNLAYEILRRRK